MDRRSESPPRPRYTCKSSSHPLYLKLCKQTGGTVSRILEQVRKAVRDSGHSRYAISKATGIDQGQLSKLIHGQCGLGLDGLERLAEFLGWEIIFRPKAKKGK